MDSGFTIFTSKLNKVLGVLALDSNKEQITKDLFATFLLKLSSKFSESTNAKQILGEVTITPTPEQNKDIIQKLQESYTKDGLDAQKVLLDSVKETLSDFVSEMEPDLSPEKVEELRKVISE